MTDTQLKEEFDKKFGMKKINSLKKKFEKDFIGGGGRFPANFPIHTNAGKIWDFIHSVVEEARKEERKQLEREILKKQFCTNEIWFYEQIVRVEDILNLLKKEK